MAELPVLCARQFQHPLPERSFPATDRNLRHDESTPYSRPVVAWCATTSSSPAKRESIMPNPLLAPLMRWFGRLSYTKLFLLNAALFVGDVIVTDMILFVDALLLGLGTLLLANWTRVRPRRGETERKRLV